MKLAELAVRVRAIDRAISESCCRVESEPWGAFVSNAEFPRVRTANCAWVDRWPEGLRVQDFVGDIAELSERLGLAYLNVAFFDPHAAFRLQTEFASLGLTPTSEFEMVHVRRPDRERADGIDIHSPSEPEVESYWDLALQREREIGCPEEEVVQSVALSRRRYDRLGVRPFLASIRGRPVGYASLLSREAIGYIDDLYTPPEDRKRGVGSTLVLHLLEVSLASGNTFTSLTTERSNTAQEMYRKLGFMTVGERRGFEAKLRR